MRDVQEQGSADADSLVKDIVVGLTDKGKEVVVHPLTRGYYGVRFATGGQLPSELNGKFMTYKDAEDAAKLYLAKKNKKVEPTSGFKFALTGDGE